MPIVREGKDPHRCNPPVRECGFHGVNTVWLCDTCHKPWVLRWTPLNNPDKGWVRLHWWHRKAYRSLYYREEL